MVMTTFAHKQHNKGHTYDVVERKASRLCIHLEGREQLVDARQQTKTSTRTAFVALKKGVHGLLHLL